MESYVFRCHKIEHNSCHPIGQSLVIPRSSCHTESKVIKERCDVLKRGEIKINLCMQMCSMSLYLSISLHLTLCLSICLSFSLSLYFSLYISFSLIYLLNLSPSLLLSASISLPPSLCIYLFPSIPPSLFHFAWLIIRIKLSESVDFFCQTFRIYSIKVPLPW